MYVLDKKTAELMLKTLDIYLTTYEPEYVLAIADRGGPLQAVFVRSSLVDVNAGMDPGYYQLLKDRDWPWLLLWGDLTKEQFGAAATLIDEPILGSWGSLLPVHRASVVLDLPRRTGVTNVFRYQSYGRSFDLKAFRQVYRAAYGRDISPDDFAALMTRGAWEPRYTGVFYDASSGEPAAIGAIARRFGRLILSVVAISPRFQHRGLLAVLAYDWASQAGYFSHPIDIGMPIVTDMDLDFALAVRRLTRQIVEYQPRIWYP